ncbi:hypothetical protein D3C75_761300 [compost metagenome]
MNTVVLHKLILIDMKQIVLRIAVKLQNDIMGTGRSGNGAAYILPYAIPGLGDRTGTDDFPSHAVQNNLNL